MPEPTEPVPEATSLKDSPLQHFIWGAIPAALAVLAVLWHLLDPYVPFKYQGLLFGIAVYLGNISLAVWLWCTVQVVRRQFVKRNLRADARAERLQREMYVLGDSLTENQQTMIDLLRTIQRSLQHAHRHMDKQDKTIAEQKAELAHLRKLILQVDATEPPHLNGQQLGPRRLN